MRRPVRVAAALAVVVTSVAGCGGERVFTGDATRHSHTVVMRADAGALIDVSYLDARGHTVRVPDQSSWSRSLDARTGQWVSFVAGLAPTSTLEQVTSLPRCTVTVDGHTVTDGPHDSPDEAASCSLAGWVVSSPPRTKAPGWVGILLAVLTAVAVFVPLWHGVRLAWPV